MTVAQMSNLAYGSIGLLLLQEVSLPEEQEEGLGADGPERVPRRQGQVPGL